MAAAKKLMSENSYSDVKCLARAILKHFTEYNPDKRVGRSDKVHLYGTQVLILALICHCLNDLIREGDGDDVGSIHWWYLEQRGIAITAKKQ